MTPAERRQRELDRTFQLGWDSGADDPPLTPEQVVQCAFIIRPRLAAVRDQTPATLPKAA